MNSLLQRTGKHKYSLLRAIRSTLDTGSTEPADGLEREIHRELQIQQPGRQTRGFLAPLSALVPERRDLTAQTGVGAVPRVLSEDPIDLLRARMVTGRAGATVGVFGTGLVGLPRITQTATTSWVGEGAAAAAETNLTTDQVALVPHTLTAFEDVSRRMLTEATEDFMNKVVRFDLAASVAHALDLAALNGSGTSNQPLGLLQNPQIPTTWAGPNGAAITFADIAALEAQVAGSNGDVSGTTCYVTSPAMINKLRTTPKGGSNSTSGIMLLEDGNQMCGHEVQHSTAVPSNITSGTGTNLSAILYGDFSSLCIALWSETVDVLVNPYTLMSVTTSVRVSIFLNVDCGVRQPLSFAKLVGCSTT